MKKFPKAYNTGDTATDQLILDLAEKASSAQTLDLLREILTTIIKLGKESQDKGDLKLVNNALKELRYSFKVFAPYRNIKKVIIFGSARSKKNIRRIYYGGRVGTKADPKRIYDRYRRRTGSYGGR